MTRLTAVELEAFVEEKKERNWLVDGEFCALKRRALDLAFVSEKLMPPDRKWFRRVCPDCGERLEHRKYRQYSGIWEDNAPYVHYWQCLRCAYDYARFGGWF